MFRRIDTLAFMFAVFLWAVAVDLVSKEWAVSHANYVLFNRHPTELPRRLLACVGVAALAFVLTRLASWRGLGRQWGVWAGCAVLAAGILGNGVSPLLWSRGVPDFIGVGSGWFWNLADFEIALGLPIAVGSVAISATLVLAGEDRPAACQGDFHRGVMNCL